MTTPNLHHPTVAVLVPRHFQIIAAILHGKGIASRFHTQSPVTTNEGVLAGITAEEGLRAGSGVILVVAVELVYLVLLLFGILESFVYWVVQICGRMLSTDDKKTQPVWKIHRCVVVAIDRSFTSGVGYYD